MKNVIKFVFNLDFEESTSDTDSGENNIVIPSRRRVTSKFLKSNELSPDETDSSEQSERVIRKKSRGNTYAYVKNVRTEIPEVMSEKTASNVRIIRKTTNCCTKGANVISALTNASFGFSQVLSASCSEVDRDKFDSCHLCTEKLSDHQTSVADY